MDLLQLKWTLFGNKTCNNLFKCKNEWLEDPGGTSDVQPTVEIQSKYNQRTVNIQSTYSQHTVNIQSTYSQHTIKIQSKHNKKVHFVQNPDGARGMVIKNFKFKKKNFKRGECVHN